MICARPEDVPVDWVFAYGSLIWDPGMAVRRSELGRVHGYHRAFCICSTHYRGTPERPGIVLGLDRGGSCTGMALLLDAAQRRHSLQALYEREIPDPTDRVYRPQIVRVRLASGTSLQALSFVAERDRPSYVRLPEAELLMRLAACRGQRGENRDYAINTWEALRTHGVHDSRLAALVTRLRRNNADPPE